MDVNFSISRHLICCWRWQRDDLLTIKDRFETCRQSDLFMFLDRRHLKALGRCHEQCFDDRFGKKNEDEQQQSSSGGGVEESHHQTAEKQR